MDDDDNKEGAARGGRARAARLTPEERSAAATAAAKQRWLKETHTGLLRLGEGIPCSVLSNGMRVFSTNGLLRARIWRKGQRRSKGMVDRVPSMLAAANLAPFLDGDLRASLASPVRYKGMHGGTLAVGYGASILHRTCDAILEARSARVLRETQQPLAATAEVLLRGSLALA